MTEKKKKILPNDGEISSWGGIPLRLKTVSIEHKTQLVLIQALYVVGVLPTCTAFKCNSFLSGLQRQKIPQFSCFQRRGNADESLYFCFESSQSPKHSFQ